MDVNCCYVIEHRLTFPAGKRRTHGKDKLTHRLVLQPLPAGNKAVHTHWFKRAFRIRLTVGLDSSKAVSTSSAATPSESVPHLADFHHFWCPGGPSRLAHAPGPESDTCRLRAATVRERFLSPAREPLDRSSQRFLSPARESLDRGSHPGSTQKPLADARGSIQCARLGPLRAARSNARGSI